MKKIIYAGIIACTIGSLFIGCRKDDDNKEGNSEASIVGVWHPLKQAVLSGKNGNVIDEETYSDCEKQSTFEFTSAGKVKQKTYVSVGGTCELDDESTVDYTFDKGKMELTMDGATFKLLSLTSSEFSAVFSEVPDQDGDGIVDLYVQFYAK
ncbi:MAG: lipocalin family protein [Flavobacteriaceae bacterium]|jgi:hypothetical protein|nr:lipocalin family protein [Flavobacteriaceae bacterium]